MELRYKNVSLSGHDLDELNKGHFSAAEPKLETKIKEFFDLPQTKFDKTYEIVEYSHVTFPHQYRPKSLSFYADKHVSTFRFSRSHQLS